MDLSPYVESVRAGVSDAAALADDHTRHVADRLGTAIESTTRLALIRALSDAADSISADLAPASVTLRMSGSDPEFDVAVPSADPMAEPTLLLPERETLEPDSPDLEEESTARISLRLPASVKARVDQMADREQISTNAWLLRAIMDALGERRSSGDSWSAPPAPPAPPIPAVFGMHGPFGPHGVFGAHGPFAPGGLLGPPEPTHRPERPRAGRGRVQGWVR
jgi:hypothetical protein